MSGFIVQWQGRKLLVRSILALEIAKMLIRTDMPGCAILKEWNE